MKVLYDYIKEIIVESEKSDFKKLFLTKYTNYKQMTPRGEGEKEVRVGLIDATKTTSETESKNLIKDLGYEIVDIISPGFIGSKSSKYKTYVVKSKDSEETFDVVYGSANKGEKFEAQLHSDLSGINSGLLGDSFLNSLGVSREEIVEVEPSKPPRKRPLSKEIKNVGKEISDITLKVKSSDTNEIKRIFISLKDPKGGTFANQGYGSGFIQNSDGTISLGSHKLDDFIEALGIDKEKIARGVSDYALGRESQDDICNIVKSNFDADKVALYLASALGYGYIYARQKKDGFKIINLESPDDAKNLVGRPIKVLIRYARFCGTNKTSMSKGTTARIETDNGAKYAVEIRNASGKIRPTEIKIKILSYPSS